MEEYKNIIIYFIGFVWILFASHFFAKYFKKFKLPLITGFLFTGIVCGPQFLELIEQDAINNLGFVNDIALAFIAFAAGSELFLKDIRRRVRSIIWNTVGQLIVTFVIGTLAVYLLADYIPFMRDMTSGGKMAVAILAGTIFVARSPSSAIAVISEMRAKGPFTQTIMGVTVVIDVLVIVLFAISFSIASTILSGADLNPSILLILLFELALALLLGYLLGKLISGVLSLRASGTLKMIAILAAGYGVFLLSHSVIELSHEYLSFEIHIEPLLICIAASFFVTNYSKYRQEFQRLLEETGPMIYVAFFTLIGAMLEIDILAKVWAIALILFAVRIIAMIIGSFTGTMLAADPKVYRRIGWMPYVTQAGVGLGLAAKVAGEFDVWGAEFATIIIAVIVLNQIVGPPLFKWAIVRVREAHKKAKTPTFDGERDAIIFGLEDQSLALARQLKRHHWGVKIASLKNMDEVTIPMDVTVEFIEFLNLRSLKSLEAVKVEAIVLMLSDEENFKLAELVYENFGTKEIIVRLNDRVNFNRFHELGALIMDPSTAMVGLMDHMVRAPMATSMLLGMDEEHDTEDIEVRDRVFHGASLRDLRLPQDILILSVQRKGHMMVTHGYTRLRFGDIITVIGSADSLEQMRLQFEVEEGE